MRLQGISPARAALAVGTTSRLATQVTLWLSSDFTLLFCVCFFLKQPHNILQKRLMETNLSKLRSSRGGWTPKSDISAQTNKLNQTKLGSSGKTEDEELIMVSCQVIVPAQPSVYCLFGFFLPPQILFPTASICCCSPHYSIRVVHHRGCHSCRDAHPLQLRAAVSQRKRV